MGLLNDVRFYLMIALAALFLIVVGMCSSAYESGPDSHASAGVTDDTDKAGDEGHASAAESENTEAENTEAENMEAENMEDTAKTETDADTDEAATTAESAESTGEATTETDSTAQTVAATATAAATTAAVANAGDSAAEATDSATETAEENMTEAATAEGSSTTMKVEGFELSDLANTGEKIPDFSTDLGNLKSDMVRYSGRVDEATSVFDKMKEMIAK